MALSVGSKAPEFTLPDTDRKERSLNEFLGKKTILVFYPGAFTGVCTKEMCTIRDSLTSLKDADAQVVGISVDAPAANKAFATHNHLDFPLLSDYTRNVSKKYGGLYEDFGGLKGYTAAKRSVFILDKDGKVQYAWISDNPGVEPNYDEVKKKAAAVR